MFKAGIFEKFFGSTTKQACTLKSQRFRAFRGVDEAKFDIRDLPCFSVFLPAWQFLSHKHEALYRFAAIAFLETGTIKQESNRILCNFFNNRIFSSIVL
ncbi:MAG: hypothetical protein MZU84_07530 [Sphingobacterium sp.]|nr:hypothetical protein [Sphingobacterium sp.]